MQLGHRQRGDEVSHLMGSDDEQPVGLLPVAGDLGEKLVGRDPGGHRDIELLPHPPADIAGDQGGAAIEQLALGDIQVGFVEGQRLDQLGVVLEDPVDLPRHLLVDLEARLDEHQVGTELLRLMGGHGRPHPKGPGFVVAGGDHPAAIRGPAYRQRLAAQARIVTHLDGRIEAVTVDMDDLALALGGELGRRIVRSHGRRCRAGHDG